MCIRDRVESIQSKINIRYVIAGLHNLTRMTTESNSALGKAEVIALEPFSTDDDILRGIQLITKPMAALGFYFCPGSEDPVSYTHLDVYKRQSQDELRGNQVLMDELQ